MNQFSSPGERSPGWDAGRRGVASVSALFVAILGQNPLQLKKEKCNQAVMILRTTLLHTCVRSPGDPEISPQCPRAPVRSWGAFGPVPQELKPLRQTKGRPHVLCSAVSCKEKRCPLDYNSRQTGHFITGYDKLPRDAENSIIRSGEWHHKCWRGLEDRAKMASNDRC